jgi:large subunit ribosomal protein L9
MPVKVILKEDIGSLGKAGELVTVKPGYARNYLIPRGVAIVATLQNLVWLKEHREKLESEAAAKRAEFEALKSILDGIGDITIEAPVGPTGKLFGRVTAQAIAEKIAELSENKLVLAHKVVVIQGHPHGIDELGSYTASVGFGPAVKGQVNIQIIEVQ